MSIFATGVSSKLKDVLVLIFCARGVEWLIGICFGVVVMVGDEILFDETIL